MPYLDKVFFANSGAECVEAAIKFARGATGRPGIVYCAHAYHGLTYGALSLTDDPNFRGGFEPLLPGCTSIPSTISRALEQALSSRQVAAFIVEPIQGKGVNMPTDEFLPGAAALCRHYGTLLVADEIQTGMGRTGRFLAVEHWNVEPDIVLLSKALSGGHVPVGALLTRKSIFDKIFNQMDRAVVHGSTFAKNDLAMAAGIATLEVIETEKLIEAAAKRGAELRLALTRMVPGYELMKEVRGKGLMIGVEFGPPKSLRLKASWNLLESRQQGPVLPAHHGAAVQGSQDPDPGLRPRQPHRQAVAAADDHRRRLQLDRDGVRFRHRLQPQGSRRDLVARQDAGRQRGAEVGVGKFSPAGRNNGRRIAPFAPFADEYLAHSPACAFVARDFQIAVRAPWRYPLLSGDTQLDRYRRQRGFHR